MYGTWTTALIVAQAACAYWALHGGNFAVKSGTAGIGAILCALLWAVRAPKLRRRSYDHGLLITAYLFSIAGDYCLSNRSFGPRMFDYGVLLFLCAHLGYMGFALMHGRIGRATTQWILAGYLVFFFVCLWPHITSPVLAGCSLAYLVVSCLSLGAALGITSLSARSKWAYVTGIALILLSDTIIGLKEFSDWHQMNYLIMPTYYLAHIMVAIAVVLCDSDRDITYGMLLLSVVD